MDHKNIWIEKIETSKDRSKGSLEVRVDGGSEPILALAFDDNTASTWVYNYTHALKFIEGVRAGISIQSSHKETNFTVHSAVFEDDTN